MKYVVVVLLCIISFTLQAQTFQETKKQARIIWSEHRETLYYHCPYDQQGNVLYHQCGYQPKDMKRAKRIEWEHVVPASWFGKGRPCWTQPLCRTKKGKTYKGRNCCEKIDPEFNQMYTDLHNLVPVIGEINKARGCFKFGELGRGNASNGFVISESAKRIEPCNDDKGLVARIYLYMQATYRVEMSTDEKTMFLRWNQQYPPTEWEYRWNKKINEMQHTDNYFISHYPSTKFNR